MNPDNLSATAKQVFDKIEFDADEKLLLEIRKHPFGLFLIYATGTFVSVSMLVLAVVAAFMRSNDPLGVGVDGSALQLPLILISFLLVILSLVMTAIGSYLYKANVVLVTSEKISQQLNVTLFNRKISQLSIGDVQDVTVTQKGIFAHLMNYGTIVIETAGEQSNYTFTFTPKPYEASKVIVSAHELNLRQYGN